MLPGGAGGAPSALGTGPRRRPPSALPGGAAVRPGGKAPAPAPRSPQSLERHLRGQGRSCPRVTGAGVHSQRSPAKCPISGGVPLFPEAPDLQMVVLVSSPLPAPLSYFNTLEKPVILDRNLDCEIDLCAPLQRVTSGFFWVCFVPNMKLVQLKAR